MNWASIIGSALALAGVVYVAWKTAKSSDRALAASERSRREEAAQSVSSAESSGFTRAQQMIESAAQTQKEAFDSTVASMRAQMTEMQRQIDAQGTKIAAQAGQIDEQHRQLANLQDSRDSDRRLYVRHIEVLNALLDTAKIVYPPLPDNPGRTT